MVFSNISCKSILVCAVFLGLMLSYGISPPGVAWGHALKVATENGLSMAISSEGQLTSLSINGQHIPMMPGPLLKIRDMSRAGQVSGPNLLVNAGFEQGMNGWTFKDISNTETDLDRAVSRTGGFSLRMHGTGTEDLGAGVVLSQAISVSPGSLYRVSGYFLSSRGYVQGVSGTPTARQDKMWRGGLDPNGLYVQWVDSMGNLIDNSPVLVAPLHWNANSWRRIGGEIHAPSGAVAMQVLVVGRLQDEYLWVDDLGVVESPEKDQPVAGNVIEKDGSLIQTAQVDDGLSIRATYTPVKDYIRIHLELEDHSNRERALEVSWGLPLVLTGAQEGDWKWWDDVHHSRPIRAGAAAYPQPEYSFPESLSWQYEHVVSGVWNGWMPVSLYPYAAIGNGEVGLAMAVSLDSPRLVKFSYDQVGSRFQARSYLGISPQALKLNGRAELVLELYLIDPRWGFRSAMGLFAKRHPEWFESPRDVSAYNGYERDHYLYPEKAGHVLELDADNIFSAEYTVADAPVDIWPSAMPLPCYHDLLDVVSGLSQAERDAIEASVAHGSNGDWQLKHVGDFKWAAGKWRAVWFTSVDPDIPGGWAQFLWDSNVQPAINATEAAGAVLDGILMDNFMSVPGVDLGSDHVALADTSLTYDIATYRPGIHNMANMHEYFTWLRNKLHEEGRDDMAITVNFWGMATPNGLAPWIDAFGGEGQSKTDSGSNWTTRILDYRRAIAYGKAMSWANEEKGLNTEEVNAYVSRALFYGIYPERKEEATGWAAGAEEILTSAQGLFSQYASAGWEPVTYAESDNENIWVERFGPKEASGLFFTIYNSGNDFNSANIIIESASLGLADPESAILTDITTGQQIPFELSGENILFTIELEPWQTSIVQVTGGLECSLCDITSAVHVFIDADPAHGPGMLSPLWKPGVVWEGGGSGGTAINPHLVDYWAGLGGFDRIGLVRIVPELDSMARGAYSLSSFAPLVQQVRDHGGRLLVKIKTTPLRYTNTPDPPDACPPNDPSDWHYPHRYNRYGIKYSQEAAYKGLIRDFIRYFSGQSGFVVNPELFGDEEPHAVLGMPGVLYELWDEPNYDMQWCDNEENFWHLYQIILEAADEVRGEGLLSFTIGGPGWRQETLRNPSLAEGFGAPGCLKADDPACGAVRRFYDFLADQGYLENGHISWWSYSYLPTELTSGATKAQLENLHAILDDPRYAGHYSNTLIVLGEWGPPFGNASTDLLPARKWLEQDEYGKFFGKNINDDNEVGASLIPARIHDMARASQPPSLQSYFEIGEWPTGDFFPLFKGTTGVFTAKGIGLLKAVSNVFLMLNRLQPKQLATRYRQNPGLNAVATAGEDGKIAVLAWYHPGIKPYETNGRIHYDDLMADLGEDGIQPVTITFDFSQLAPNAAYNQTLYKIDRTHSNSFTYRHEVLDRLFEDCGADPSLWQSSCIYSSMGAINSWTLGGEGPNASVALESSESTFSADTLGNGQIAVTMSPYSVSLITLERCVE